MALFLGPLKAEALHAKRTATRLAFGRLLAHRELARHWHTLHLAAEDDLTLICHIEGSKQMREAAIHSILRVRVAVRLHRILHVIRACKLMVLELDVLQPWLLRL